MGQQLEPTGSHQVTLAILSLLHRAAMHRYIKIIVEKHPDGYVAYPIGIRGAVVGQGGTYEEALADARSAVAFHVETFGPEVLDDDESPVLEVFIAEAKLVA